MLKLLIRPVISLYLCVCQAVGLFLYLSLSLAQSPECLPDENEIISPLSRPARKPSPECPPNKKKSPITPSSHLTSKQSPKCSPDENESNFGFSNSFFSFLRKNQNSCFHRLFVIHFHWPILTNCVCSYTTSKRIELESPGCSGFEANFKSFPMVIYFLKL